MDDTMRTSPALGSVAVALLAHVLDVPARMRLARVRLARVRPGFRVVGADGETEQALTCVTTGERTSFAPTDRHRPKEL